MNYLAHAFLSGGDADLLTGNFIGDHVRGSQLADFPAGVQNGIRMHRQIDSFTDLHPSFRAAKRHFYGSFERYSGILVDIYFDHLLARGFDRFSPVSLQQFSAATYLVYNSARNLMPPSGGRFLEYVLKNDIYQSYAATEGIERVLFHLSQRIGHGVRLDASLPEFRKSESALQDHFDRLLKDLLAEFGKHNG